MEINKLHYKQLSETKKIYLDTTTLKIREKLNIAFKILKALPNMLLISFESAFPFFTY